MFSKKESIRVLDPENKANYIASTNETPFLFSNNSLWGTQPNFKDIYKTTEEEVKKSKPFFKVELSGKEDNIKWLDINRPTDEWSNGKKSPDLNWAENGDSIIVSPHMDHRLWIISKKGEKLLKYKEAKANKINSFRIIEGYPIGDEEIIKTLKNGRYEILLYDKFRKVYYRFFYPGIDSRKFNLSPRQQLSNNPKIGILILDNKLDIIGEYTFGTNYIESWNYFVGRKGLYVSTKNPNRGGILMKIYSVMISFSLRG
ncbi:DUF4221 family protein [Algoriphagus halophilus]|uniref:Uncharacterized protein n=1 Tax=Algoriphagus halophilus TaxID=226505 RepID=A0A1N6FZI8_9BACT|nr:DUF4221 family protein [Algoriphagus halophilus]SIO00673.1 protein of unknown function [Algoriphagus halophilus]